MPISASITLTVLNWKGFYIGGELQGPVGKDDLKFLGLQLAAKMIELLAVASLSTIMLALVRGQLMSESLPFGAVTAGYEFSRLSFLWSRGFVATCVTKFSSVRQKTLLITTIIVFTILSTTIGPSAATAALPVLRNWPAGGTVFWLNATSQELWPSRLDEVAVSDLPCTPLQNISCFPGNYDALADGLLSLWPRSTYSGPDGGTFRNVIPEKVFVAARRSMRALEVRFKGPFIYQPELTAATTPSACIADAASQMERYWFIANQIQCLAGRARFCYYKDLFSSVKAMQPVTYVRCSANNVDSSPQFPKIDQEANSYPLIDYKGSMIGSRQWFEQSTRNGSSLGLSWVDLAEDDFGQTSVGAVVALPAGQKVDSINQVLCCTIDARWAHANATVSFLGGPDMVSGSPKNWFLGGRLQKGSNGQPLWSQIRIGPSWGEAINPIIPERSISVFEMLCNSVARLNDVSITLSPVNAAESILAVMITDSLARTGSLASILGSLKGLSSGEWSNEFLPKHATFGPGGSAFNYTPKAGENSTKFEMRSAALGYGYGIATANLLSMIVLCVYSLIAIIHVFTSVCCTKTTSSAWESITEIIALAVSSSPSPSLRNTGAGIDTLGVFKQPVKIGVSDECLQMVFNDEKAVNKVSQNEYYG